MGNLTDKVPAFLREYKELSLLLEAEQTETDSLYDEITKTLNNEFVLSADLQGIIRFEKMLGITPKAVETIEDRRFRVFGILNEKLPYTERKLNDLLEILCGKDGYGVSIDYAKYEITVKINLVARNMFDETYKLLLRLLPANMLLELILMYNQYLTFESNKHSELEQYTHIELRERNMNGGNR